MRFRELFIENFGIHRQKPLSFAADVQLLYGPNEAGKSTLLRLLQEVLFRIDPRSPYLQCSDKSPMAAELKFELQDGRTGQFRRQKGMVDNVSGKLGETVLDGQPALDALLGEATSTLYKNVFAFSAEELRTGAESLRDARLEEALFGGSIGGLGRFRQLEAELAARISARFLAGARAKNPTINRLLAELKQKQAAFVEAQRQPQDYEELCRARQAHDEEVQVLQQQVTALEQEAALLRSRQRALPAWHDRSAAREERRRIHALESITPDVIREFRTLQSERLPLVEQLQGFLTRALQRQSPAPLSDEEAAVLAVAEAIEGLKSRNSQMSELSRKLPRLQQQQRQLEQELSDARAACGGVIPPVATLAQREMVQSLKSAFEAAVELRAELKGRRGPLDRALLRTRRDFEQLGPARDEQVWKGWAERARGWKLALEAREALNRDHRQARQKGDQVRNRLLVLCPQLDDGPRVMPLRSTVEEHRLPWQRQAERVERLEDRAHQARAELRQARGVLAELDRTPAGDDRGRLAELRQRRDRGWALLRRKLEGSGRDAEFTAEIADWTEGRPDQLVSLYEAAIAAVDQQVEQSLAHAADHARRNQQVAEVERLEARLLELESDAGDAVRDQEALRASWRNVWAGSGVEPLSPVEMLEWLDDHAEWQATCALVDRSAAELADQQATIDAFESRLGEIAPDAPLAAPETVVRMLSDRAHDVITHEAKRSRLSQELDELQTASDELSLEEQRAAVEEQSLHDRLQGVLRELALPEDWNAGRLALSLEQFESARLKQRALDGVTEELSQARQAMQEFEAAVASICRGVAPHLVDVPALTAAERVTQWLEAARSRRETLDRHAADVAGTERVQRHTEEELARRDATLAELCRRVGVASVPALEEAIVQSERATGFDDALRAAERDLRNILGPDWDRQTGALEAAEEGQLMAGLERIGEEIDRLKQARDVAIERRGEADRGLGCMADETEALARGAELAEVQARLVEEVHQWGPLALTQTLMQRALQRFEKEQQPRMLEEVARLLERITGGEHVRLERTLTDGREGPQLMVRGRDDVVRTPDQLSTGARAQLYLAIRLAFVADYCRQNEPLPLVMDDILEAFDESRQRRTLEVLAEFSEYSQVVLLTHHWRTVELWREVRPEAVIVDLGEVGTGAVMPETPSPAKKPGKSRGRPRKVATEPDGSRLFPSS